MTDPTTAILLASALLFTLAVLVWARAGAPRPNLGRVLCAFGLRRPPIDEHAIHLVDFATQPDIRFACDLTWSEPSWDTKKQRELPFGIHLAENGRTYAFDVEKVTCERCRKGRAP